MISLIEWAKLKKDFEELKKQFQMLYANSTKRSMPDADKIRGVTVVTDDPTDGQALVFDAAANRYMPKGIISIDTVGWLRLLFTLTYVNATTFTIPGDVAYLFPKGSKLRLTQTTPKYFYVIGVSYSAPNTIVNITGGVDYTLSNAAITEPFISYEDSPRDFPHWFNWTPTIIGYSVLPSNVIYAFRVSGRTVFFNIREVTAGISNSVNTEYSPPINSATGIANLISSGVCIFTDNGIASPTFGRWTIDGNAGGNILFGIGAAVAAGFTPSGGKRIAAAQGFYEI